MVVLGLGTNLNDRYRNMESMIRHLQPLFSGEIIQSPLYESEPVGVENHPVYLNCVIAGEYHGSALEFLKKTQYIENELGRVDKGKLQPRTADIDILLFNNEVISTQNLIVPHHALFERRFEIEGTKFVVPHMKIPGSDITFAEYEIEKDVLNQVLIPVK